MDQQCIDHMQPLKSFLHLLPWIVLIAGVAPASANAQPGVQEEQGAIASRNSTTLTLAEALDIALTQHPALHEEQAVVEAAKQRVRQEVAGYLPRGSYTYRYTRQQIPLTTAVGGIDVGGGVQTHMTSQTFNFNSTNFTVSRLLFDFGRGLDSIRSAVAVADASRADLEALRQTVIFNTKQAYYALLSAQRLQQVAAETVRQTQQHLEEAQARFEVGLAPRFKVKLLSCGWCEKGNSGGSQSRVGEI